MALSMIPSHLCFSPWVPLLAANCIKCSTEGLILQREKKRDNGETSTTIWFNTLEDEAAVAFFNDGYEPSQNESALTMRMGLAFTV